MVTFLYLLAAPSISNMAGIEPGTVHIPIATPTAMPTTSTTGESAAVGEDVKGKRPKLPSFWIPTLTPNAKPTEIKKPVMNYMYMYIVHDSFR